MPPLLGNGASAERCASQSVGREEALPSLRKGLLCLRRDSALRGRVCVPHAVGVQHQAGWRAPHPGCTHCLCGAINRLPTLGRQDLEGGFLGCLPRALGIWPHPQPEPGPVALRRGVEGPLKGLRQA